MGDLIVAFLRACLDDDERVAREASGDPWRRGAIEGYPFSQPGDVYAIAPDGTPAHIAVGTRCGPEISPEQSSSHIARHDPARVLAEVAAKRAIVDWVEKQQVPGSTVGDSFTYPLFVMAAVYADRVGYRPEWAPVADQTVN